MGRRWGKRKRYSVREGDVVRGIGHRGREGDGVGGDIGGEVQDEEMQDGIASLNDSLFEVL